MDLDESFIKLIKKKDNKAILKLYNFTFNKIMGIVVRFFNNEDERVTAVNNSFMKIIDNIDKFQIGTAYFSWVNRITHNEIITIFRKNKKYKSTFNFDVYETIINIIPDKNSSELQEDDIEKKQILQALNLLPKASRIVFDMYVIEGGYTYKEIAKVLNVSTETVKWHLKQARKVLKRDLTSKKKVYAG